MGAFKNLFSNRKKNDEINYVDKEVVKQNKIFKQKLLAYRFQTASQLLTIAYLFNLIGYYLIDLPIWTIFIFSTGVLSVVFVVIDLINSAKYQKRYNAYLNSRM